jgi:predicted phosphodiesterase
MRTAIVSDIHGNITALEAVLADLRLVSPDVVFHGGDLADSGSGPAEVVDCIRTLGWQGVVGNTDETVFAPASIDSVPPAFRSIVMEIANAAREALGEERIAWLRALPRVYEHEMFTLFHASRESLWRPLADDDPGTPGRLVVYGHIHKPFVRGGVINTGSVSLAYDGDPRASYLLIDNGAPAIRRVEYDVAKESKALVDRGVPRAEWIAAMLASGRFIMP